jgi:hypothetical protein
MNKQLKSIILWIFLGIFLIIPCITAYSLDNLINFYKNDTSNFTNYNTTITLNNDFSINFWLYHTGITNTQYYFNLSNSTKTLLNSRTTTTDNFSIFTQPQTGVFNNYHLNGILPTNTAWNMLTITYDRSLNTLKYYYNATLINTNLSITSDLTSITNYLLNLGIVGDTYKLSSLWNTELNIFDIIQLYNNGNGLNYTDTLLNSFNLNNVTPLCIDNHNLCNYPFIINNDVYCEIMNTVYCSVSCNNSNDTGVLIGYCDSGLCSNDCNILGYQDCDSTTSFKICGNYDTDNCLEYSGSFGCLSGQLCSNGYCISNVGDGLTNNSLFTVTPYAISDDNTFYNLDINQKKLSVNTKNLIQVQKFSTNTNAIISYTSRTCDYKETLLNNILLNSEQNTTYNYYFNPIAQSSLININLKPNDLTTPTIVIKNSLNQSLGNLLYITRNSSDKSICIYSPNASELEYCSYSVNSYDDLNSVNVTYNFEFQSKTYTITVLVDRIGQSETFSLQPQAFNRSDISKVTIINYPLPNGIFYLSNIDVIAYTQPSSFYTTLLSNYDFLKCIYSKVGCYNVRSYNNNNGISDFTNYYDYQICINTLNNPSAQAISYEEDFFSNLSTNTKYLIMILSSVFILLFMTLILALFNEALSGLLVGLVMSMIVSLTLTLILGLTLLIPILYIIIGGSILAFLIRKIFTG